VKTWQFWALALFLSAATYLGVVRLGEALATPDPAKSEWEEVCKVKGGVIFRDTDRNTYCVVGTMELWP
jgi:hypothetical protein